MAKHRLSNVAKEDLIRIHHSGVDKFGVAQADIYLYSLFEYFDIIAQRPFYFESVDFIKPGYRRAAYESDSIYFRVNDNIIDIKAIVGKQDLNIIL